MEQPPREHSALKAVTSSTVDELTAIAVLEEKVRNLEKAHDRRISNLEKLFTYLATGLGIPLVLYLLHKFFETVK